MNARGNAVPQDRKKPLGEDRPQNNRMQLMRGKAS